MTLLSIRVKVKVLSTRLSMLIFCTQAFYQLNSLNSEYFRLRLRILWFGKRGTYCNHVTCWLSQIRQAVMATQASKKEKDPVNIVHQNAILCETIMKEQRHQKLYTSYSVNPYNKSRKNFRTQFSLFLSFVRSLIVNSSVYAQWET